MCFCSAENFWKSEKLTFCGKYRKRIMIYFQSLFLYECKENAIGIVCFFCTLSCLSVLLGTYIVHVSNMRQQYCMLCHMPPDPIYLGVLHKTEKKIQPERNTKLKVTQPDPDRLKNSRARKNVSPTPRSLVSHMCIHASLLGDTSITQSIKSRSRIIRPCTSHRKSKVLSTEVTAGDYVPRPPHF